MHFRPEGKLSRKSMALRARPRRALAIPGQVNPQLNRTTVTLELPWLSTNYLNERKKPTASLICASVNLPEKAFILPLPFVTAAIISASLAFL